MRECSCTNAGMSTSTALGAWTRSIVGVLPLISSSKGKDYTYLYGKHVGVGSLTPYIDKAFDSRIDEYVKRTHISNQALYSKSS